MNYRLYLPEDYEQIKQLCNKYGIEVPNKSMVYVASDKKNKIHGFVGIKADVYIEPLISENPLSTAGLFGKVITHLKQRGVKTVRCVCSGENSKLFERIGFEKIEENKIIMEKEI